jgi:hypothetical protein
MRTVTSPWPHSQATASTSPSSSTQRVSSASQRGSEQTSSTWNMRPRVAPGSDGADQTARGSSPACTPASLGAVIPSDEEILRAIVALGDDGFVPRHQLVARFRRHGERDMRRAIGRSARRGLLLKRKDPEGRSFVAVSTEGWQALRSGEFEPRRLRNRED